jgi:hypothetical protein
MVESQIQKKELLEEEVDVSFFIQFVTVEGQYSTYHKLYAKISSNETEVTLQYLSPEERTFSSILKDIEKLYEVYKSANNQKLAEGAKEEMLKLVALILWNINH